MLLAIVTGPAMWDRPAVQVKRQRFAAHHCHWSGGAGPDLQVKKNCRCAASTRRSAAGPNNSLWAAHQVDPEYGNVDMKNVCSTLVHNVIDLCSPMVEHVSGLV